jgi:hypothetical protein
MTMAFIRFMGERYQSAGYAPLGYHSMTPFGEQSNSGFAASITIK